MECVLKDLIVVSKDGEWGKGESFTESVEMLAIRGTDFEDVRFGNTASTPRRHIQRHIAERKTLQPWDVIIEAAGGTKDQITGRTVILRPQLFSCSDLPLTCASFSRFIRFNTELCDPEFMFWYLQYLYASGAMHAYHTQHTGVARFQWTTFSEREPLSLPPLPTQRRIAGILSAYDELIENSQRRIKILEQMARGLYREWFVHFRFPGHEGHPRVASAVGEIPAGWEVRKLSELLNVDKGVSYNGAGLTEDGNPMVNLKNIQSGGGFRRDATKPYSGDFKSRHTVKPGDVVVANTDLTQAGNVVASPALIPHLSNDKPILISHHLYAVRPVQGTPQLFIYHLMLTDDFRGYAKGFAIGTTVLGLPKEGILNYEFACPPLALVCNFVARVSPINELVETLHERIQTLRRTRDLLLPRLLAGQVELAEVDE